MRLLIFLLALTSAFFVPASFAAINYDDLKSPKIVIAPCDQAYTGNIIGEKMCSPDADTRILACESLASAWVPYSTSQYEYNSATCIEEGDKLAIATVRIYSDGERANTTTYNSVRYKNLRGEESPSCPPPAFLDYTIPTADASGQIMCAKEYDPFDNCPASSENDLFTGGVGSQTTKCFANPDGTQCKISTEEDGSYYLPVAYSSSEPEICRDAPYEPVEQTDPVPQKEPTLDTDDTPQIEPIDAMNLVNENLNIMNTNQIIASNSNDALLTAVVGELQIGNKLTGQIRDQPSTHTGLPFTPTTGTGTGTGTGTEPCTGDDCIEEPEDNFSITGSRKAGGLNSLFTQEDTAQVIEEIETKRTELTDYIEVIKNESTNIFDVDPHLSGGYEERKEVIKGVEVDLGLGRFSSFFQLLAPAIMLISAMSALYIILGSNQK